MTSSSLNLATLGSLLQNDQSKLLCNFISNKRVDWDALARVGDVDLETLWIALRLGSIDNVSNVMDLIEASKCKIPYRVISSLCSLHADPEYVKLIMGSLGRRLKSYDQHIVCCELSKNGLGRELIPETLAIPPEALTEESLDETIAAYLQPFQPATNLLKAYWVSGNLNREFYSRILQKMSKTRVFFDQLLSFFLSADFPDYYLEMILDRSLFIFPQISWNFDPISQLSPYQKQSMIELDKRLNHEIVLTWLGAYNSKWELSRPEESKEDSEEDKEEAAGEEFSTERTVKPVTGFLSFLSVYGSFIPLEACKQILSRIPRSDMGIEQASILLAQSVRDEALNKSLIYACLHTLFLYQIPFPLPFAGFIEKIYHLRPYFNRQLLVRYIINFEEPEQPGKEATDARIVPIIFNNSLVMTDIDYPDLKIEGVQLVEFISKKLGIPIEDITNGSKLICLTDTGHGWDLGINPKPTIQDFHVDEAQIDPENSGLILAKVYLIISPQ